MHHQKEQLWEWQPSHGRTDSYWREQQPYVPRGNFEHQKRQGYNNYPRKGNLKDIKNFENANSFRQHKKQYGGEFEQDWRGEEQSYFKTRYVENYSVNQREDQWQGQRRPKKVAISLTRFKY